MIWQQKDFIPAIVGLGILYENSDVLAENPAKANELFLQAFELRRRSGLFLALNRNFGIGTKANIEKAIKFYEIAINRGVKMLK